MAFDVNTFIVKQPVCAIAFNSDNTVAWNSTQVKDLSIKVDGNEILKKDAYGSTIASISQAKSCEVDFNTPVFDLNIVAAMNGSDKENASVGTTFIAPSLEKFTMATGNLTTIVLANSVRNDGTSSTPDYQISVTLLGKGGEPKKFFTQAASVATGKFTYTNSTKTLTFSAGDLTVGDTVQVFYRYDSTECVRVVNSADKFPNACKTYIEVEGFDVCDQNTKLYAWFYLPNAKMQTSYTLDFASDSESNDIPVALTCAYDYCTSTKELYQIIIPSTEA